MCLCVALLSGYMWFSVIVIDDCYNSPWQHDLFVHICRKLDQCDNQMGEVHCIVCRRSEFGRCWVGNRSLLHSFSCSIGDGIHSILACCRTVLSVLCMLEFSVDHSGLVTICELGFSVGGNFDALADNEEEGGRRA